MAALRGRPPYAERGRRGRWRAFRSAAWASRPRIFLKRTAPTVRIVDRVGHQARSDRVIQDVVNDGIWFVVFAKHALEVPVLPEPAWSRERGGQRCTTTKGDQEAPEVRRRTALDQRVHVVRHERVRKNFKVMLAGGT